MARKSRYVTTNFQKGTSFSPCEDEVSATSIANHASAGELAYWFSESYVLTAG